MSAARLNAYIQNVTIHRESKRLEISVSGDARFFFRYDEREKRWQEYIASCPLGAVSTDQRVEANGILNGFLDTLRS